MHRSIGFYLRIYGKILVQDIKSKMSYRSDFIISTIGMICTNIAGFVSFWILLFIYSPLVILAGKLQKYLQYPIMIIITYFFNLCK